MDFPTSTNPETEAPEAEEQEVETAEDTLEDSAESETPEGSEDEAPEEDEELDIDGNPLKVPKSVAEKLKARMMMQADYTQKTQAIAEQRREYESQRQAFEWEQQTRQELFREEAQLHTVRERLANFQGVNWQELAAQNPQQAIALQAEYTQLRDFENRLSGHVEGRKAELSAAREQETAIALSKAVEVLNKPAPAIGWDGKFDAEKRDSLTKFGLDLGFTNEELANTSHPLMIQTLNLARIGYETLRKQSATLKKPTPEAKPVPQIASGKTRTGPFNPDKLGEKEWLKWRESEIAKKQKRAR